ncbi:nitrate reductase subunit alpha [Escherichia coli]|nr:nitrate reductase subunit alpha [Escherichia coli]
MSKLLDRFRYFKQKGETFADGHGQVMHSNRDWEDSYRQRWQFDKIVRSTHGVNCTGSCSWKIYVKNGLVTWEIQQTDYPRTRPDLPNHEPRGCPRGASYSWYLYSANRLKYPLIRKRLIELWREALKQHSDPVLAWASIMNDPQKCLSYKQVRGRGGFIRSNWQELNQLIAAANVWTIKTYGPDRVAGFSPIPAMSMVSYAAGTRYLSLLGGTCLSFYDWYCDLPPASPMTWGEQTDVPESADWYNSSYIIAWGSNVPQTRTPDAHFFTEVRYKGTKTIAITPDYSEVAKLCDQWLAPKQGTDSALAMAMGHVILKEFHLDNPSDYFINYCRRYSDMPMLVMLEPRDDGSYVPGRMIRASDLVDGLGESNNPQWKTVAVNTAGELVVPNGSIGFRWGEKGKWNLESIAAGTETELSLTLLGQHDAVAGVAFPYFGGIENPHFRSVKHNPVLVRQLPVKNLTLVDGNTCPVVSVYDLVLANYGLDRGLEDENSAKDYAEIKPYTPAWGEQITGVPRQYIETIAREFADTAHKTHGRSMIILGAGVNHWYHMDMNYRGMINMLIFCGCVGQSGGGWAHYVGQEKLRPQTGWLPLAFALDWNRPPRQMNSTSFFYNHSSQWRYEKVSAQELLSPLADASKYSGHLIDFNVRAERMGWLPSAPQLGRNPLGIKAEADKAGLSPTEFTAQALKSGDLRMACEQPDSGSNHPRNLFVWRSNLLGSSGKGHEYMQKYLLGTESGIQGEELGASDGIKPEEVEWQTAATGIGYPKNWEDQEEWQGGWVRDVNGKIRPRLGSKMGVITKIFANPVVPQIDDYYEPFTFDYEHLHSAPEGKHIPTARPRSLIDGKRMDKVIWGPNWEELLGGEFEKRARDRNFEAMQKEMYGQFENTFMMYLPRLCEHCLNPSCVATCPSGAIYKREEDGIVLIDQDKCRGWRLCISGCPYKKIYFNWKSGKSEKCIFCYPRIESGQPTVCSETCVGRIRYLGVLLYDADRIEEAASTEREVDLYERQCEVFLDPHDPSVIEEALKQGIPQNVIEAAQRSPVYKMAMDWKLALPLHPEYRTLPMVWYVPPLSPIQSYADAGGLPKSEGVLPAIESLRIPVQYLANMLSAGDTGPVLRALKRMMAMRHYMRSQTVEGVTDTRAIDEVGLSVAQVEEMYRYLAIANYEDRFVIPTSHREMAGDAFAERNGCGFTFGDGCHGSDSKFNLFNSSRIDAINITEVRDKAEGE